MLRRDGRKKRGKILATKLGFNPNSSSLGVDVTFLLFSATALSFFTPIVAGLLRTKKKTQEGEAAHVEGAD